MIVPLYRPLPLHSLGLERVGNHLNFGWGWERGWSYLPPNELYSYRTIKLLYSKGEPYRSSRKKDLSYILSLLISGNVCQFYNYRTIALKKSFPYQRIITYLVTSSWPPSIKELRFRWEINPQKISNPLPILKPKIKISWKLLEDLSEASIKWRSKPVQRLSIS